MARARQKKRGRPTSIIASLANVYPETALLRKRTGYAVGIGRDHAGFGRQAVRRRNKPFGQGGGQGRRRNDKHRRVSRPLMFVFFAFRLYARHRLFVSMMLPYFFSTRCGPPEVVPFVSYQYLVVAACGTVVVTYLACECRIRGFLGHLILRINTALGAYGYCSGTLRRFDQS